MKIIVEANIPYIKGLLEAFRFSSGHAPGATAGCFQEAV